MGNAQRSNWSNDEAGVADSLKIPWWRLPYDVSPAWRLMALAGAAGAVLSAYVGISTTPFLVCVLWATKREFVSVWSIARKERLGIAYLATMIATFIATVVYLIRPHL